MTKVDFAKIGGVTHAAVVKWENYENSCAKLSPATETRIRLFALEKLFPKSRDFIQFYRMLITRQIQGMKSLKRELKLNFAQLCNY